MRGVRDILEARAAIEEAVRAYFNDEGFVEVTTPVVVQHPNLDPNIQPIPLYVADAGRRPRRRWLHTSPELAMKKLLARGSGNIFQISPVFRGEEHTHLHRTEFTMLEWYRVDSDYEDAIRDTIRVLRAACRAVTGGDELSYGGRFFDLARQWEEITMAEAFRRFADVATLAADDLQEALKGMGYRVEDDPDPEDLFFRIYVEAVEPFLGLERPTIIKDYPSFLGTMAAPREDDPHTLERFEVYIAGLELANGYTESADSVELSARMEKVIRDLSREGAEGLTIDEQFLEAMTDLPPCSGVSVGMDRLLMLALDVQDIAEVVFPFESM